MLYKNNKQVSQQNRMIFALRISLYNIIRRDVTVEGISPYVLPIGSILFSDCYALFYNFHYLQSLLSENNIITDDAQRKNTV